MKKHILQGVFLLIAGLSATAVFAGGKAEKVPENKLAVAVTFDAIKELTAIVGGDKVYIRTIIPSGVEAHDFEPKAGDLRFLNQAQVLVYNGFGMEHWIDEAVQAVNRKDLITVFAGKGIEPLELDEDHHHHHHHHGHSHGHEGHHHDEECDGSCGEHHGGVDPHIWLSLESAKIMTANIAKGLSTADPANAALYQNNAERFASEADALLTTYRRKFAPLPKKHFVTGHAAFGYLCRDLGLEQNSVEDVFSAGEPSAKQLTKLVDYCNRHGITTVFSETMASPQVSATLAKEVGASVEVIYTIESAEDGLSYMDRMNANIEKIYNSLLR
ncbi:MAG: zinc ABC transporter substrate-binding protein [Treponema sp.]